jgi:hypothetical protein
MVLSPTQWWSIRGVGALAALPAIIGLFTPSAHGDPLLTRNQNPLLAPYGLPSPLPARLPTAGSGRVAATVNWANAAAVETTGPFAFTLDGEAQELRVRLEHGVGTRFAVLVELPWRHLSGGSLDGFVLLHVDESSSGIADIPISLACQIKASDKHAVASWVTVKLPVGDANRLTGSGATDVAASLSGQTQLADRTLPKPTSPAMPSCSASGVAIALRAAGASTSA